MKLDKRACRHAANVPLHISLNNEAKTVQNRPSDGNALEPRAGVIHGLAVLGKVHQQQGNGGTDNSCDGGDGDDLRVDILHDLAGFRPDGGAGCGCGIISVSCESRHRGQCAAHGSAKGCFYALMRARTCVFLSH